MAEVMWCVSMWWTVRGGLARMAGYESVAGTGVREELGLSR